METRSCELCGAPLARRTARFCSPRCSGVAKRKSASDLKSRYRMTSSTGHPLAGGAGNVTEHRFVLFEKIGPGSHPCHWCGMSVKWTSRELAFANQLQVDHVNGDRLDNSPENLVPSCPRCNIRRGNPILVGDSELYVLKSDGTRHRAVEVKCEQCGKLFLARVSKIKYTGKIPACSTTCGAISRAEKLRKR